MSVTIKGRSIAKWILGAVATVAMLASSAQYYARAEGEENPYLEVYKLRVTQAELNLKRQNAIQTLAKQRLERGRKLMNSSAISAEEYDTMVSEATVAEADVSLATQKISESKAYLKIIEVVVARGESIPLCTYEME